MNTPLGYAPPRRFFWERWRSAPHPAAAFGTMVYLLPLYHPLRLIDEICMLDQMSGGSFLFGVGRRISRVEVGFFDP